MSEPVARLLVRQTTFEADRVLSLTLVDPAGKELPEWQPGAHIDVVLPSGLIRQYSLCSDPLDRLAYRVAVLLEESSRGGSREVHSTALTGKTLEVRGPRNHFRLVDGERYLLLAGGIGVTPLAAMARQLELAAKPWRLVYGGRSAKAMAFCRDLAGYGDGKVDFYFEDVVGYPDLRAIVAGEDPSTEIYACGPAGMLRAVEECCEELGRQERLHLERFTAAPRPDAAVPEGGTRFRVELRRSGLTVDVDETETLLAAIRRVFPDVLSSCEEGYCGTCETKVLGGIPDHHDQILSESERAANDTMMICVGRSRSAELVLDL